MASIGLDRFRIELTAIRQGLTNIAIKTVRNEDFRERIRNLFRVWITSISPELSQLTHGEREVLKLSAELEALAALANKIKSVNEYKKRINRAILLADQIVVWLPSSGIGPTGISLARDGLFVEGIPDLPSKLVPNALIGWREKMKTFVREYTFDRSIFLMIRYHNKNEELVKAIKDRAGKHGCNIILARDHRLTDDLYNPIACLLCCSRGLAVFDQPEIKQVFNPNVAYEVGMMHLLGRDCRVLKHTELQVLHTDILMKLYEDYSDIDTALKHIDNWLR
jgi:hypothetical protein